VVSNRNSANITRKSFKTEGKDAPERTRKFSKVFRILGGLSWLLECEDRHYTTRHAVILVATLGIRAMMGIGIRNTHLI
jgi:hypothetical protein